MIFLDTETTGLSAYTARIIEIAAIKVDSDFNPVGVFHTYLNPGQPVGSSYRIHGISDAFLANRARFVDVADQLIEFVSGQTLCAHNMSFDRRFLQAELARCGKDSSAGVADWVDTLRLARRMYPGRKATLDALAEAYGLDASARRVHHGALIDTELLVRVYLCLQGQKERAKTLDFSRIDALIVP